MSRQKSLLPRPGWYTDPEGDVRWWDGEAWTDKVRARPLPSSAVDIIPALPEPEAAAPPQRQRTTPAHAAPVGAAVAAALAGGARIGGRTAAAAAARSAAPGAAQPDLKPVAPPAAARAAAPAAAAPSPAPVPAPAVITADLSADADAVTFPAPPAGPAEDALTAGATGEAAAEGSVLTLERPVDEPVERLPAPAGDSEPRTGGGKQRRGRSRASTTPRPVGPTPWAAKRPKRRRAVSPLLAVVALVGVIGVVVAFAFSAGYLGQAAEPDAAPGPRGELASQVVSETGTGVLLAAPAPRKGFVGTAQKYEAVGNGTWLSPGFLLGPGQATVAYAGTGRQDDAVISLVPQFTTDPSARLGEVGCYAPCSAARWTGTPAPGRYKLSITTTSSTAWTVTLAQKINAPGTPVVVDKPEGTSSVWVASKGPDRTSAFTVQRSVAGNGMTVVGTVAATRAFTAYLVPKGRDLDPKRDLVFAQKAGDGGTFQADVRTRGTDREQTYTLVVQTKGAWTLRFTTP